MNWKETYEEYLTYSKEKLIEIGSENGEKLIELMDEYYGDQDVSFATFMKIYGTFAAIDWKITQDEYELFRKITGVSASFNEFVDAVKDSNSVNVIDAVDKLIDGNPEIKERVILMGLAISAYDGVFSDEEKAILEKYYA